MATRDYQDVFVNQKFLGRGAEKAEIKKLTAKNQKTGRGVDLTGGLVELKYFDGEPVIKELVRESKPGLRKYLSYKEISHLPVVSQADSKNLIGIITIPSFSLSILLLLSYVCHWTAGQPGIRYLRLLSIPLLPLFYEDRERWTFTLQVAILADMLRSYITA